MTGTLEVTPCRNHPCCCTTNKHLSLSFRCLVESVERNTASNSHGRSQIMFTDSEVIVKGDVLKQASGDEESILGRRTTKVVMTRGFDCES
jgi:hypothetical protein